MRTISFWLPAVLVVSVWGADDTAKTGFVYCSQDNEHGQQKVFLNSCISQPIGNLRCGEKVEVVGKQGLRLKIKSGDSIERFIPTTAISQDSAHFIAVDLDALPTLSAPDCNTLYPTATYRAPRVIFQVEPEYTSEARRKHIQGEVLISFTVGTDGRPLGLKVEHGLGYGLDENALLAVKQFKFDPARRNGEAIEARTKIWVSFHLYGVQPSQRP